MPAERDDRDIEIIPPERPGSRRESEWVFISFGDGAKAYRELPLYKRVLFAAASLVGLVAIAAIVFLVVASAVLVWIPLMLATALIVGTIVFLRTQFRR